MKRFLSTLSWDVRLQFRNGFYYASGFVAALAILFLRQLPQGDWARWWPPIILENLIVNAFYFTAGLVLLEKGEGTLTVQTVTPLRPREYLLSKALSLGLLSTLETLALVVFVTGIRFNWPVLVLGILCLIAIYTLYGFFVVTRYDSISEFLLPSALWTMWFSLPLLYSFNLWRSALMFLHPLQAPLVLMQAAFEPVPTWQMAYGVLYSALWIGIVYLLARSAYHRFVIRSEGTRTR